MIAPISLSVRGEFSLMTQGENMPRLTKAAALAKSRLRAGNSGGRPKKTVPISFRLPESLAAKLGSKPHKRAREIVERELGGS